MPRTTSSRTPSYRLHKPSGQAVVTLNGKDHYLGDWNFKAGKAEYDRLIGEWLASGRRFSQAVTGTGLTIAELSLLYRRFAEDYYVKAGRPLLCNPASSFVRGCLSASMVGPQPTNSAH